MSWQLRQRMIASILALIPCVQFPAHASTCVDGTFIQFGNNSNFEACYDSAPGGTGLFGVPTLVGNNILLSPNSFTAESLDGEGTRTTNSTIHIRLAASESFHFEDIDLLERGDYKLNGLGSSVDVGGQLQVQDLVNIFDFTSNNITPASSLTNNDNTFHNWEATASVNLTSAGFTDATLIDFVIENRLEAFTLAGIIPSQAFIEKKFAATSVTVSINPPGASAVPIPASIWMFASGLFGIAGIARKPRTWRLPPAVRA